MNLAQEAYLVKMTESMGDFRFIKTGPELHVVLI